MLTLKCTKKVQDFLGVKKDELASTPAADSVLGAWYVHQFQIGRSKSFIFMNERTLLSFVLFGAKKSNSPKSRFPEILLGGLVQLLKWEGFPNEQIARVVNDAEHSEYAGTDSRSVLGNMNELVFLYQHHIAMKGGLEHCNLAEIICQINRTPQRNLGWGRSITVAKELLSMQSN